MKRTISFFLSVFLLVAVFAPASTVSVFAEGTVTYTSGYWRFTASLNASYPNLNSAYITKYTGSSSAVTIPSTLNGWSVRRIEGGTFSNCTSLTSVTIPDSVTSIGGSAFSGCRNLTSINVSSGNPNYASKNGVLFNKDQTSLICYPAGKTASSYTIPDSVTSIGSYAFRNCSKLTSITIPDSVTSIGNDAFFGCTGLTSITIPDSVTSIGNDAFSNCTGLTSITIPDSVTSIGSYAFRNCTGLTSITIPDSVTSIGSYAFDGCTSLSSITIPESVTSIGSYAFYNCTGLSSITIPESVTSIGDQAFNNTAWYNDQPNGLVYAGKVAYKYKGTMTANTQIILREDSKGIAGYAFSNCTNLSSITIPDSVTSIGASAFYGCNNLTIYGFAGTYAESYANSHSIVFQPIFTPGDIKLDGQVDVRDLNEFLYLFNSDLHLNPNADCNADGSINLSDATLLAKYLAGWNVALGVANPVDPVASSAVFSLDPVTVPEGENVISVPVRISGLSDADDLGAVQLNVGYDKTKLKLTACHTAQDEQYDADFFDTVSMTNPTQANGNFSLIALTTQTSNPNWASDYEFNDYEFAVLDFEVLGLWADTVPLTLTGTALRRSDDAPLQVAFTNGSVDPVRVSGVELDAQELFIKINESASLTASVSPANARLKTLTWTSSDPSVATVSNGMVSAKKPGNTTITVTTVDGGFTDACSVTVYCEHVPKNAWTNDASEHWQVCSICKGKIDVEAHSLVENPDAKYLKSAATCISPAVYYKSCFVCGYRSNEAFAYGEVNLINHVDNSAKPLLADPYTHYKLCDCGERVLVTNHTYQRVDAYTLKCSVCDHVERFGDLTGDGSYTGADVSALAQIAAGNAADVSGQADTNFDGSVTVADVMLLAKKIAGWNVNLGENTAPAEPVANNITVSADSVNIAAGATTVTVPIHLSGVTDIDDLGALQIELNYDATKLQPVSAYCTTGTGRNKVSYGADELGNFTSSAAGTNPYRILTWNTSAANLNLDSEKQINSKEYAFVEFSVLGEWFGETPVSVSAIALRRSDGATLAVSTENGSVKIVVHATGMELTEENVSILINATETLHAVFSPENTTETELNWTSSDPTVATVENGVVTALAVGETIITATTADGGFTDACTITVYCNHTGETHIANAVAATCTADGYTGDTVCDDCGATIVVGKPISALGHDYKGVITNPTCTEQGYTTYTCSRCGDSYVADYTDTLGHTGGTATCTHKAVCERCHEEYGEPDPNNHEGQTELIGYREASCFEEGYTGDTYCTSCHALLQKGEVIPTGEHNPASEWTADGVYHWHECQTDGCGNIFDKAEHTGGVATCSTPALCEICGASYGEPDPENHVHTTFHPAVGSTCTVAGHEAYTICDDCGKVISGSDAPLPLAEHTPSDAYSFDEAEHWKVCTACGAEIAGSRENHTGVPCSICGKKSITFSAEHVTVDPGASRVTVGIWVTGVADEDDLGSVDIQIAYDTSKLDPTACYYYTGSGKNKVSYGGDFFGGFQASNPDQIPSVNPWHIVAWDVSTENQNWDTDWGINDQAFAFIDFDILDTREDELPLTVSGRALRRSDSEPLSVQFVNGSIRFRTAGILGDVDGDGVLGIGDITMLAKAVAGWDMDSGYDPTLADCDGDGVLGIGDITLLAKAVAGWNVTLGPQA